eukprot:CAMPEP_0116017012 /NCGR_PEP_ID=MMETSP0321-20121206/7806_1 /TAXON_ID=163516 /ORGANISM="Leptocylindrus danicus var. danicus, Strain B650" /LENGTH=1145 /DNA_ID=CAMNT_0003487147 /DNA_START=20 /DNA_END=3457 /DNA_ORIENTATION=-
MQPNAKGGNKGKDDGNLKVVIRVRPFVHYEKGTTRVLEVYESFHGSVRNQVIQIKGVKNAKFTFDHVLQSNTSQVQLYETCVTAMADQCMTGYNATIIAYGQTGSGKTWTIIGPGFAKRTEPDKEQDGSPPSDDQESDSTPPIDNSADLDGVVPRALKDIFNRLEKKESEGGYKYHVKLQFLELYGEQIRDLLSPSASKITIRDLGGEGVEPQIIGATQAVVKSAEEALQMLEKGSLRRATASTNMNADSSRSHALMTVYITQETKKGVITSKFQFVDLAGSERLKRTGAEGRRMKEGIDINKGLLTLANVISALGDPKKRKNSNFVPYRDSKLTHILKGSIGGNHKTLMITCVSPAASNAIETENSLRYANRAKNIQNRATVNMDASTTDSTALKSQVHALAVELLRVRGIAGSSVSGGPFTSGVLASLAGGKDVKDVEAQIAKSSKGTEEEKKKIKDELSAAKLQLVELTAELEGTKTSEREHKRKIRELTSSLTKANKEKESQVADITRLNAAREALAAESKAEVDALQEKVDEVNAELEKSSQELSTVKGEREKDKERISVMSKELSTAVSERDKYHLQLDAASSNDVEKDTILEETAAKLQKLQGSYDESRRNLVQATEERDAAMKESQSALLKIKELEKTSKENQLSSLARVSFEKKIAGYEEEITVLKATLAEEREKSENMKVDVTVTADNDDDTNNKLEDLKEELVIMKDKHSGMKAFYEEKIAGMEAAVEEKEEERGQLILELNELQQGGPRKTYDLTEEEQVQMKDILRVRLMSMKVVPLLLEDENQRAIAQRNGLTDAILQEMAIFPDDVDLNAAAFHALVLLARPLGGKEGSLFQGSMINSDIMVSGGHENQNGIAIMLNAMRRFDSNELLQAMGCWAIVNIALVSDQRTMLLRLGGLSVVTNAMRRHPYDIEVQLRAVSALVNLVKPFDSKRSANGENLERQILDDMVESIADLIIQAMKNCCSHEVILSRACLVLGNLSFRKNYKNTLLETPECCEMLEWCMDSYEDNKLIQRCAKDTLQRLGKLKVESPPPSSPKKSNGKEQRKSSGRSSSSSSVKVPPSDQKSAKMDSVRLSASTLPQSLTTADTNSEKSDDNSSDISDLSVSTNGSKRRGFGRKSSLKFFRSKKKSNQ